MNKFIGWLGALLLLFLAGFGLTQWLLLREFRQAIAQLSADSQFLEQVREIIRFFKSA